MSGGLSYAFYRTIGHTRFTSFMIASRGWGLWTRRALAGAIYILAGCIGWISGGK